MSSSDTKLLPGVPTQTQLYAFYITTCIKLKIHKPNQHLLDLLEEDNYNRRRDVDLVSKTCDNMTPGVNNLDYTPTIPLATLKSIPSINKMGHVGSKGMMALIALFAECPFMEIFDISGFPSIFVVDAYGEAPLGNEIISAIASMGASHPSLKTVDVSNHPVGAMAAGHLLKMLNENGSITSLNYDEKGVPSLLQKQIIEALRRNNSGENTCRPVKRDLFVLSPAIANVEFVDRKTMGERLALQTLLDISFGPHLFSDGAMLNCSIRITLGEAALRGSSDHLYVLEEGAIEISFGPEIITLQRGDYFNEPSHDVLHSRGLMRVQSRGTAFMIPLKDITNITKRWADNVRSYLPFVRKIPLFQPLHMWTLCRLCQQCSVHTFDHEGISLFGGAPERSALSGLCVVMEGEISLSSARTKTSVALGVFDLFDEGKYLIGSERRHSHACREAVVTKAPTTIMRFDDGIVSRHVISFLSESLRSYASDLPH